jgi:hypothetical protein
VPRIRASIRGGITALDPRATRSSDPARDPATISGDRGRRRARRAIRRRSAVTVPAARSGDDQR